MSRTKPKAAQGWEPVLKERQLRVYAPTG